jgi:hypothetical protein
MPSWSAEIQSQINVVQTYQHETYTFLRYCEQYIVGYSTRGVQIIKGKCHYGGIRDLGVNVGGHYPVNLPAWIGGVVTADLPSEVIGVPATQEVELPAWIGVHQPGDLGALIGMHAPEDITAYIRGFDFRDLSASITSIYELDLPASVYGIPPVDLSAYLKVWPQEDLLGSIHGWDTKDLLAYIIPGGYADLGGVIDVHRPKYIRAWIKGWVREATHDLGGSLQSYAIDDLGAIIRPTEMAQLPAYLFPIQPVDLTAFIHGWDTKDLQGIITVSQYPWNLPASINITGGSVDLTGNVYGRAFAPLPTDLTAFIYPTKGRTDLQAIVLAAQARNLGAYIDPGKDQGNLIAEIYPKRIRLTGVISLITMEHRDMSATISIPCFYSNFSDLSSYVRAVYQSNLSATLYAKGYTPSERNLGASFGYSLNTVVQDKFQLNLHIKPIGYRTEDKIDIRLAVYRGGLSLGAYIYAARHPRDLGAYINGVDVIPYNFETWKGSERVFKRTYSQVANDFEDISISFQTMVKEYFYSSGSDVVAKVDKYQHFVTKVASYYSPATSRRLDRRLHKVKHLYDMRYFDTTDEAMRYAIWYVTTTPSTELGAYINSIVPRGNNDLTARIGATRYFSEGNNLTSHINGTSTHSYDVVIGFTDDGVEYLEL